MVSCVNHRDREAVAKCRRCGRPFCAADLEPVGKYWYDFDCLKEIAREARAVKYGKVTASLAVGALLAVALGTFLLYDNMQLLASIGEAVRSGTTQSLLTQAFLQSLLPVILGAVAYYALAIGMMANRRWAFPLGLLLNTLPVLYEAYFFMSEGRIPEGRLASFVIFTGGPLAIVFSIVVNRHELTV